MKTIIKLGGVVVLAIVASLVFVLYKTGEEMTMFRCGGGGRNENKGN